jgi:hypothetical protein
MMRRIDARLQILRINDSDVVPWRSETTNGDRNDARQRRYRKTA